MWSPVEGYLFVSVCLLVMWRDKFPKKSSNNKTKQNRQGDKCLSSQESRRRHLLKRSSWHPGVDRCAEHIVCDCEASERQVPKCSAVPGGVRDGPMSYLLPHSVVNLERRFSEAWGGGLCLWLQQLEGRGRRFWTINSLSGPQGVWSSIDYLKKTKLNKIRIKRNGLGSLIRE